MLATQIPMYSEMLQDGYTEDDIVTSGYFLDKYNSVNDLTNDSSSHYNDSLFHLYSILNPTIIIAISGCFSPIHAGHIQALIAAKAHYNSLGYTVMGVIIPAHDSYVDTKRGGVCKCSAIERIIKIKKYLEAHKLSWIGIDEYPALYWKAEVNFPFLLDRLHKIFNKIKLGFVYGADNSDFIIPMSYSNYESIIVNRNNSLDKIYNSIAKLKKKHMYTVIEDNIHEDLSSTSIRHTTITNYPTKKIYMIRDDSMLINNGMHTYTGKLIANKLTYIFDNIGISTIVMNAIEQIEIFNRYMENKYTEEVIISLDKYFKGDFQFKVSRLFSLYTYQGYSKGLYYKNLPEFEEFLTKLPLYTKIVLVDDDKSSGMTISTITNLILSIRDDLVISTEFINEVYLQNIGYAPEDIYDIVDIRDFIFNSSNGGLMIEGVTKLPKRYPYVYPYVNLHSRAKIPYNEIINFTQFLYSVNK